MCGIAGIASRAAVDQRDWLRAGITAMTHRGPDDEGVWWSADGRVGVGHRRLAVIDLSQAGHQPMHDGDLSIVFNGEIYNFAELRRELIQDGHTFTSDTDTEVLLKAYRKWGADLPERLNGMFAFALFDGGARRLLLARDRAGEKPLFYRLTAHEIRFASELKALMADPAIPRRVHAAALDSYLAAGFVAGESSILEGIAKLPPAHALTFDIETATARRWRYWTVPEPQPRADSEPELVEEFERLLEDSVRRQLVADVPTGVLLSGGLDSSLVTAMAARSSTRVRTFSIRFPGHASFDETAHARLIAKHFGTTHTELEATAGSVDDMAELARQFDEPIADSSMIPTGLVSRLVREHCTVALGGDGGDELFGGYRSYDALLRMQQTRVPLAIRRGLSWAAGALLPIGFKGRGLLQRHGADLERGLPLAARYFDARWRDRLLGPSMTARTAEDALTARLAPTSDLLRRATREDFENYLPENILVKVDRASMLHSLEVRAPLLDHRIVEFAFGRVPSSLKATPSARKVFLRKVAARVLPPDFDSSRKQGFSVPLAAWMQHPAWQARLRDTLLADDARFDKRAVTALMTGQARGRSNADRLFALLMFESWRREYRVTCA